MVLDISINGKLSIDDAFLIDSIAPTIIENYNRYIGNLISDNKIKGHGLLLSLLSRDPRTTPMLGMLCGISLLETKIDNGAAPDVVVVDYDEEAQIVQQVLDKFSQNNVKIHVNKNRNALKAIVFNIIKTLYVVASNFLWFKLSGLKNVPSSDIMFIDTFVFPHSFGKDYSFVDRYYAGESSYFNSDDSECWYAPTLVGVHWPTDYFKIVSSIRKCADNFILQEVWLTLADYIYAFKISLITPLRIKKINLYCGYDVSSYVSKQLKFEILSAALFKNICKYRFVYRLSRHNIKISTILDWNENQSVDKALVLGCKKYYPEIPVVGYRGFIASSYMASQIPTAYEFKLGVVPDVLAIISPVCKRRIEQSCSQFPLIKAPAFRFSHLLQRIRSINKKQNVVFVALPFSVKDSIHIIDMVLACDLAGRVRFIINHHPVYSKKQFLKLVPKYNSEIFEHSEKKITEYFSRMSVLISGASSVCIEAVSLGIYVAVIGNRYGVTDNPIPLNVEKKLWKIFYDHEQLQEFINDAINNDHIAVGCDKLFYSVI